MTDIVILSGVIAVTVYIYNTQTEPEHIVKDLSVSMSPETGFQGNFRDAVSIDQPVIMLQADINTGNYAWIQELDRYYWIVEKTVVRTGLTQLVLQSDPLMTFRTQILDLPILVKRCERQALHSGDIGYNGMIPDSEQIIMAYQKIQVKPIMSFEWSGNYNLVTVG